MELAKSVGFGKSHSAVSTFEPTVEPEIYADIDRLNGWTEPGEVAPEDLRDLASAFSQVLAFCWSDHRGNVRDPDAALRRFCAFSMVLKPEMFPQHSYASMAKKLRCTKAAISKLAVEFSDKFDLHFRRSRSETARLKFSLITQSAWKRRKK